MVVKSQLDAVGRPYKVYTALLTQSGTNAPVATVLENTLGGAVTFTYESVGFYKVITPAGVLTNGRTFITLERGSSTMSISSIRAAPLGTSLVQIQTLNQSLTPTDNIINGKATFEIRVYN